VYPTIEIYGAMSVTPWIAIVSFYMCSCVGMPEDGLSTVANV